ncbi:MAG TPA: Rho termination factor N-terminal domain-containing protein, partial [Rubrobacter sp.]|nr:Rho termination factor N-terminal domain-containing protein [Rubrobacter sp.]
MTERSTLERKRLSDLHQIASQLGIKQYRKYRKPELAEMIYQVATEQAASQQDETATNGGAAATATQEAPVTTDAPNGSTTEAPVDGFGEADTNLATTEQVERQRQERGRRDRKNGRQDRRQEQRGDRDGKGGEENVQSGILDVLPDGFGFLRTGG